LVSFLTSVSAGVSLFSSCISSAGSFFFSCFGLFSFFSSVGGFSGIGSSSIFCVSGSFLVSARDFFSPLLFFFLSSVLLGGVGLEVSSFFSSAVLAG